MKCPNPIRPDHMSAVERLAEVGRILALGVIRARDRHQGGKENDFDEMGDVYLDFRSAQRGHVSTKQWRGDTA